MTRSSLSLLVGESSCDSSLLGTFVFLIAGCAAPERSIGVTDFMVPSKDGEPEFSARIWYSGIGGTEQRFGSSRIRPGYGAVPNAAVASKKQAPLIVLAHGSGGSHKRGNDFSISQVPQSCGAVGSCGE